MDLNVGGIERPCTTDEDVGRKVEGGVVESFEPEFLDREFVKSGFVVVVWFSKHNSSFEKLLFSFK